MRVYSFISDSNTHLKQLPPDWTQESSPGLAFCSDRYNQIHMGFSARWASLLAFSVFCLPAFAQKKPVTVHDLFANGPKARTLEPIWRPDGAAFPYPEIGKLMLYDNKTRHASAWRSLVQIETRSHEEKHHLLKPL